MTLRSQALLPPGITHQAISLVRRYAKKNRLWDREPSRGDRFAGGICAIADSATTRRAVGNVDRQRRRYTVHSETAVAVMIRARTKRTGFGGIDDVEQSEIRPRAAVFLSERHRGHAWILASDIARSLEITKTFLEAILVELRDHGIIDSRRGRYGGCRLAHPPSGISVGDTVRIIDGPLALTPCASRTEYGDCVDLVICALRPVLQEARDAVAGVLDGCTLAQLARSRRSNSSTIRRAVA
jgi:Rrf2 family protein